MGEQRRRFVFEAKVADNVRDDAESEDGPENGRIDHRADEVKQQNDCKCRQADLSIARQIPPSHQY